MIPMTIGASGKHLFVYAFARQGSPLTTLTAEVGRSRRPNKKLLPCLLVIFLPPASSQGHPCFSGAFHCRVRLP